MKTEPGGKEGIAGSATTKGGGVGDAGSRGAGVAESRPPGGEAPLPQDPLPDLRRQDLVVDGKDFELTVGAGKIVLWLGRKVPDATIEAVLRAVAQADPRTVPRDPLLLHCAPEEMHRLQREGLELLGYALPEGRTLFRVRFAHPGAVAFYARHLTARRDREDVEETLLWRSSPARLRRLLDHLRPLGVEAAPRPRPAD